MVGNRVVLESNRLEDMVGGWVGAGVRKLVDTV